MTATKTARRTPARRTPRLGGVDPLPPELVDLVPPAVAEASKTFGAALDHHRQALARVRDSEAALDAARRQDRHAAGQSELERDPLPAATVPAAEALLADARRSADGAQAAAQEKQGSYLRGLSDHLAPIREAAEVELIEVAESMRGAVEQVEVALVRRARCLRLLHELGDGGYLGGRQAQFSVSPGGRRPHDPIAGPLREQLEDLRRSLWTIPSVTETGLCGFGVLQLDATR